MKQWIELLKPLALLLLKILQLIDPATRNLVHKRKALHWAEKYILLNEELKGVKDKKRRARILRKLKYYKKWFFEND